MIFDPFLLFPAFSGCPSAIAKPPEGLSSFHACTLSVLNSHQTRTKLAPNSDQIRESANLVRFWCENTADLLRIQYKGDRQPGTGKTGRYNPFNCLGRAGACLINKCRIIEE